MSSEPLVKYLSDGTAEVTIGRDQAMKLSVEVWANRKLGLETPSWMLDVAALVDPTIRTEPTASSKKVEWVIAPAVPKPIQIVDGPDAGGPTVVAAAGSPEPSLLGEPPATGTARRAKDSPPPHRSIRGGFTRARRQRPGR